jgi:predicted amino acid racemase
MAFLELNRKNLQHNYRYLDKLFKENDIGWAVVAKLLCGNLTFLKEVIDLGVDQVCDSRVSNLRAIKSLKPSIETIYIKPPPPRSIKSVVKYADISFNTEIATIRTLSEEAGLQGKVHKVIIMIEMGDLREGVMWDQLIDFYGEVFRLPNIEVVGIGTNLNCLNGVMPNQDKLIQLSLYEQLIEAKFNKNIPYVSGGSSVTIPLIFKKLMPGGISHFRVGETLFFGNDIYDNEPIPKMKQDIFRLFTEIIELQSKPSVPNGELGTNLEGETFSIDEKDYGRSSYRAILDLGLLDVKHEHMFPLDPAIKFAGASSDMIVVDLGDNPKGYKVGDLLEFRLDYLGVLTIMNSDYIDKKVV